MPNQMMKVVESSQQCQSHQWREWKRCSSTRVHKGEKDCTCNEAKCFKCQKRRHIGKDCSQRESQASVVSVQLRKRGEESSRVARKGIWDGYYESN